MAEEIHQVQTDGGAVQDIRVPLDRAGAEKGHEAEIIAKYGPDKHISITETVQDEQKKRQLYVHVSRKGPVTGKPEYQLKDSKTGPVKLYANGKWFPEKEVRRA